MSDFEQSIPPSLVVAEARATAHQLHAIIERLDALARLLPIPPGDLLDQLSGSEAFAAFPCYELRADLEVCISDGLLPLADLLANVGERVGRPSDD